MLTNPVNTYWANVMHQGSSSTRTSLNARKAKYFASNKYTSGYLHHYSNWPCQLSDWNRLKGAYQHSPGKVRSTLKYSQLSIQPLGVGTTKVAIDNWSSVPIFEEYYHRVFNQIRELPTCQSKEKFNHWLCMNSKIIHWLRVWGID